MQLYSLCRWTISCRSHSVWDFQVDLLSSDIIIFFYFTCSFNNWKTTQGFPVFHCCRNADWSWLVYRNQLSFSFKAQTKYVWQWSKQLTACICKHNWWSGYTLLTPTTNNGLDCVSEVIGLIGNSTKCAHWTALVNVENVKSHSSAGTCCKVYRSLIHYSHQTRQFLMIYTTGWIPKLIEQKMAIKEHTIKIRKYLKVERISKQHQQILVLAIFQHAA